LGSVPDIGALGPIQKEYPAGVFVRHFLWSVWAAKLEEQPSVLYFQSLLEEVSLETPL
jgi:hypothetical protein